MNKISIVIPVYNTSRYLRRCIDSVLGQSYNNLEIIIVNDGSTDDSLDIIREYEKKDKRVVVIDKKNGGLSSARNIGIKNSTGDYLLNVDSDDWIERNACENLLKYAIEKNADIVIGNILLEYKNKTNKWKDLLKEGEYSTEEYLKNLLLGIGKTSIWNKLIKLSLYKENGIEHPDKISLGEDGAVLFRIILHSNKIYKTNFFIYHYRQNTYSMMKNKNKKIEEYKKVSEIIKEYYLKHRKNKISTEEEALLEYKFFYKSLILEGYKETKDKYKEEWKKLEGIIENIKNYKYYREFPLKEKIILSIFEKNKLLGDYLVKVNLKLNELRNRM